MASAVEAGAFRAENADEWDRLVRGSDAATFLHTRRFLGYHGDRLADASVAFRDEDGHLVAVLPAAAAPGRDDVVVSHPGATYGGLITAPGLRDARDLVASACDHWRTAGFATLVYKPLPAMYHRTPFADDLYALWRLGARRTRADLASVIDLGADGRLSSRRRRALGKAERAGVEVRAGAEHLAALWPVVEGVLAARHGARPVHTVDEIEDLAGRFPGEIDVRCAWLDGRVVAGTVLFVSERVVHTQYLASGDEGRAAGALDRVLVDAIEDARGAGRRYFDFGTSTEGPDADVNEGLHRQKQEFGAGTALYERYELDLR